VSGVNDVAAAELLPRPVATLEWLRGEWTLTRVINDGAGRFEGRARFAPDPAMPRTVIWHEAGRLRFGGHDGPATRTLRIEPQAGGGWQVCFADRRPFHPLDLATGHWEATHLCGADLYRGCYRVEHRDRLSVTWRISGPRKDDVIASRYERAA
jgi:hypothetical protein